MPQAVLDLEVALADERGVDGYAGGVQRGPVPVAGRPAPTDDPTALIVPTIADASANPAAGVPRPEYLPVAGFPDVVCHAAVFPRSPNRGWYRYLVLDDNGRRAISFNVNESSHDPERVAAFLELLVTIRDVPFDGRSHHKLALPRRAGPFSHALLCSPALGQAARAYPAIASRVATAFPIYDCEIADHDTEALVDARIRGRDRLPYTDWAREPHPVVDLRFDIRATRHLREKTFKVYQLHHLNRLLGDLADASPDSWFEVRSFRGDIKRVTPHDLAATTLEELTRFVRNGRLLR